MAVPVVEQELNYGCLTLHEMFRIVGDNMTQKDLYILKYLYNGIVPNRLINKVRDGYEFLSLLEQVNRVDETNFKYVLDLLRMITRHDLLHYVTLRRYKPVAEDKVNEYLEQSAKSSMPDFIKSSRSQDTGKRKSTCILHNEMNSSNKRRSLERRAKTNSGLASTHQTGTESTSSSHTSQLNISDNTSKVQETSCSLASSKTKLSCDIRLRVRAEYSDHQTALDGNVNSNKPTQVERQFEKFMQANNILKSRDLGSIVCDIKFTELTYLDAFWRDYLNGSLLEALKGVFITESLKEAVGNESIKLLVSVDEDDYEAGRLKLLENLKHS